eukprot:Plantae.Rhodophyta-Rhodochaete_pulchella.ctg6138.p1 GENE.Plantae.Rhodophyta-Rhodochaete_pulchella.ctg6138~~Plantae.Rhodophyta-Rhodochaete_pulchella.ctg6138.p1  ORF type:complete len:205 (+),score=17.02 Plantae.Rhodophyta-Rhodochaete_pulchella.ctg6138:3-617(+)
MRIRTLYLRSILKQEISFYDVQDTGELTSQVAGDVDLIQAGIGDKLATLIMYTSTFVAGVIVGFVYCWKLTLVILAVVPAIIVTGAIFAKIVASATTEGQAAYARAGGVASEILCLIRTVAAFGGEADAVEKCSSTRSLLHSRNIELFGTPGLVYCIDLALPHIFERLLVSFTRPVILHAVPVPSVERAILQAVFVFLCESVCY